MLGLLLLVCFGALDELDNGNRTQILQHSIDTTRRCPTDREGRMHDRASQSPFQGKAFALGFLTYSFNVFELLRNRFNDHTVMLLKCCLLGPMLRPCSRAVALVLSTKRSEVSKVGAGGHKLVTDDVVDFLEEAGDDARNK